MSVVLSSPGDRRASTNKQDLVKIVSNPEFKIDVEVIGEVGYHTSDIIIHVSRIDCEEYTSTTVFKWFRSRKCETKEVCENYDGIYYLKPDDLEAFVIAKVFTLDDLQEPKGVVAYGPIEMDPTVEGVLEGALCKNNEFSCPIQLMTIASNGSEDKRVGMLCFVAKALNIFNEDCSEALFQAKFEEVDVVYLEEDPKCLVYIIGGQRQRIMVQFFDRLSRDLSVFVWEDKKRSMSQRSVLKSSKILQNEKTDTRTLQTNREIKNSTINMDMLGKEEPDKRIVDDLDILIESFKSLMQKDELENDPGLLLQAMYQQLVEIRNANRTSSKDYEHLPSVRTVNILSNDSSMINDYSRQSSPSKPSKKVLGASLSSLRLDYASDSENLSCQSSMMLAHGPLEEVPPSRFLNGTSDEKKMKIRQELIKASERLKYYEKRENQVKGKMKQMNDNERKLIEKIEILERRNKQITAEKDIVTMNEMQNRAVLLQKQNEMRDLLEENERLKLDIIQTSSTRNEELAVKLNQQVNVVRTSSIVGNEERQLEIEKHFAEKVELEQVIERCRAELANQDKTIENLRESNKTLSDRVRSLNHDESAQVKKNEESLNRLKQQLDICEKEKISLQSQVTEKSDSYKDILNNLHESQSLTNSLHAEEKALRSQTVELKTENDSIRDKLLKVLKELESTDEVKKDTIIKNKKLTEKAEQLEKQLTESKEAHQQLRISEAARYQEFNRLLSEIEAERAELNSRLSTMTDLMDSEKNVFEERIQNLCLEITEATAKNFSLQKEIEHIQKSTITQNKKETSEYQARLQRLEETRTALENELESLRNELATSKGVKTEYQQIQKLLNEAKKKYKSIVASVSCNTQGLPNGILEMANMLEEAISSKLKKEKELEQRILNIVATSKMERQSYAQERSRLTNKADELEQCIRTLEIKSDVQTRNEEAVTKELSQARQKLQLVGKLQQELASLDVLLQNTSDKVSQLENSNETLRREKIELKERLLNAEEVYQEAIKSVKKSVNPDSSIQCELMPSTLSVELEGMRKLCEKREDELTKLKARLVEYEEALRVSKSGVVSKEERIKELERELGSHRQSVERLREMDDMFERKQKENSELMRRILEIDNTLNLLCVEQESNHQTIEGLKKMMQSKDSDLERLRSMVNLEKSQVARLKSEKEDLLRTKGMGKCEDNWKPNEQTQVKELERENQQVKQMLSGKQIQVNEMIRKAKELEETHIDREKKLMRKIEDFERLHQEQHLILQNLIEENSKLRSLKSKAF